MSDEEIINEISSCLNSGIQITNMVLIIADTLLFAYGMIMLVLRRNMYPIMERSPITTIFICFNGLQYSVCVVLELIYLNQLAILYQEKQDDDNFQNSRDSIVNKLYFIMYFALGGWSGFTSFQLIKICRLTYSIYGKLESNRLVVRILKHEIRLCITFEILNTLFSVFVAYCVDSYVFSQSTSGQSMKIFNELIEQPQCICCLMMVIATYTFRQFHAEYQLQSECFILSLFWFVFTSYNGLFLSNIIANFRYGCQLSVFGFYLCETFFTTYIVVAVIIPLHKSRDYHPMLPRQLVLEYFQFFLQDGLCLKIFDQYLRNTDQQKRIDQSNRKVSIIKNFYERMTLILVGIENQLSIGNAIKPLSKDQLSQYELGNVQEIQPQQDQQIDNEGTIISDQSFLQTLLYYYLDVLKEQLSTNGEISSDFSTKVLQEYFLDNGVFSIKNQTIQKEQQPNLQMDTLFRRIQYLLENQQSEVAIQIVLLYFSFTGELLQEHFERFKKTISYRTLLKKTQLNERITTNLYILNMTCIIYKKTSSSETTLHNQFQ